MSKLRAGEYVAPSPGLAKVTTCRACKARIVFVQNGSSKVPLGLSTRRELGVNRWAMRNHFEDCPGRERMRARPKRVAATRPRREREVQGQLF